MKQKLQKLCMYVFPIIMIGATTMTNDGRISIADGDVNSIGTVFKNTGLSLIDVLIQFGPRLVLLAGAGMLLSFLLNLIRNR